jgi:uncharacterized membrane protein YdjX (TVP38/TMEM64 family)
VAGLTRLGSLAFTVVTVVGSAPQLLLYAYLGESAPRAAWLVLAATGVVAVGGGAVGLGLGWQRRRVRSAGSIDQRSGATPIEARRPSDC